MLVTDASVVLAPTASDATTSTTAARRSVCHILAPAEVGGLESVVRALASAQQRAGHRVVVAALLTRGDASSEWQDALRAAGVELISLVHPGRHYLAQSRAVVDLLRARMPSVVHTHGYHADVIGGLAARRLGLPTVTTVHGFTGGDLKNRVYQLLQRRAFRHFDAVIAVARSMAPELARRVSGTKLHIIPNGIASDSVPLSRAAARRALAVDAAEQRVGWIGRLSPEKGADVMIRALPLLPDVVRLSIIGDGPQRPALERLAWDLAVADRIAWHGVVPGAARFARAFDLIALSSRTEGTPIVLLEAMAAGVPIVATRVGGVPDMITDREAMLVEAEDLQGLANAVLATLQEPDAAASRAAAARRVVEERFDIDSWVDRVDAVYASVRPHVTARGTP